MGVVVRAGLIYGALCFVTGFVLGSLRELVLVPAFGSDLGRQIEFPVVTLAAIAIAWWLVKRAEPPRSAMNWLVSGAVGVVTLLAFESALALLVIGVPLDAYLAGFDIRAGALFPAGLAIMLFAPAVVAVLSRR
jgi:hypothetical protein